MSEQHYLQDYATRKDPAAFRALVEAYQGLVYSAAGRRLARQQDIEDVVQLTFLKLAHAADTIRHDLASWLYSTAVNAANDLIRRDATRRRHEAQAAFTHAAAADPASHEALHRLLHLVDEAILKLPPEQQTLIVEHFLQGRSQRDIAADLGISQATICRRMEAAIKSLRQAMGKHGLGAAPSMIVAALMLPPPAVPPMLTGQLAKIGLAGAGAQAGTVSVWVAAMGGGVKVGIAASLIAIAGGAAVAAYAMRSTAPAGVTNASVEGPGAPMPDAPIRAMAAPPPAAPLPLPVAGRPAALIARIREAYGSLDNYSTAVTTTVNRPGSESLYFLRVATDGRRVDLQSERFDRRDFALQHERATRRTWDGDVEITRSTWSGAHQAAATASGKPADPLSVTFSRDAHSRQRTLAARETGPFLAGYLQGQHVADLLETATTEPPEFVTLDNARCQLITGTGTIGAFQVWIDDRTSLLRKAVIDQKPGHLHWNERLPRQLPADGPNAAADAILSCHFEVGDIRILPVGEKWVPMGGTCTETLTYRTRASEVIAEMAQRSEFRLRPAFPAGTFQMDGIPHGHPVAKLSATPSAAPDTTHYVWHEGRVLPALEAATRPSSR